MKTKTFIVLAVGLLNILGNKAIAQENNNLYFLVDTISIPKEHRIVKIYKSTSLTYNYDFFCKCVAPYKVNLSFFYVFNKKNGMILNYKPIHKYISWQELLELVKKNQNYFDKNYNLFITELLPNKKYMTNLVKMNKYRPPSEDGVIVLPEN